MKIPYLLVGCSFSAWMRELCSQRFAVSPSRIPRAIAITSISCINSFLGIVQAVTYGSHLSEVEIAEPPLFVIGHWRSGTTLLHELLALDPNSTFPNNYCCFTPHHFLLTERYFGPYFDGFAPLTRPMDAMHFGWDFPQEDEIAMLGLGAESTYWRFAFPDRDGLPVSNRQLVQDESRWEKVFLGLMRRLACRENKRIVLKSPSHSYRILRLLEMFPAARFVYITRTSSDVLRSMRRMHTVLENANALRISAQPVLVSTLQEGMDQLQMTVEKAKMVVPRQQFSEVRFEDLVDDPVPQIQRIYEELGLVGFDALRPRIEEKMSR